MAESEEELKSLLMKVKEESEKLAWNGPITSWQIDGETVETVTDFIFLGSKITADVNLQEWSKKMLAPWKKSYDKPRLHIKKQRHYFANQVLSSQSYGLFQ